MIAQIGLLSGLLCWPVAQLQTEFFPQNLYLVRAKIGKATKEGYVAKWQCLVSDVYAGPDGLKGSAFEFYDASIPITSTVPRRDRKVNSIEEGVEGIWWIYRDAEAKKLRAELRGDVIDAYQIRQFPYFNNRFGSDWGNLPTDGRKEFEKGRIWAEAVATVYKAKSEDERKTILDKLAIAEGTPVAGWAICLLGRANWVGKKEFLRQLVEKDKLSPESQATLDRVLCRVDTDWPSAKLREDLLNRWLNSKKTDQAYFISGCQRLLEAMDNKEIDFSLYARILDPILAGADQLPQVELWSLARLVREPSFKPGGQEAFDWLAELVRNSKSVVIRSHAAAGLRSFRPFSEPAQLKALRELRRLATDPKVQETLDVTLTIASK